jgi:hypothetical protein
MPRRLVHEEVPYYAQWESIDLIPQILSAQIKASEDPLWARSGALTADEYEEWSWNCCGMACVRMLLAGRGVQVPLVVLAKKCSEYGGYKKPLEQNPGLFYGPFRKFMREEYRIESIPRPGISLLGILTELSKGNLAMASVSPEIRNPKAEALLKGGHLVLLVGYDNDKKVFFIHNPSGDTIDSQSFAPVRYEDFERFFDRKGIVIKA